jgi:hypothetical protein
MNLPTSIYLDGPIQADSCFESVDDKKLQNGHLSVFKVSS